MLETKNNTDLDESLIFSVSEVTLHIRQVLETQIDSLYIVGEISNFVRHGSGHIYFNLKDDNAVIRCAFFRSQNYLLEFIPQDGDQVVCFGKISLFEKNGQYQLIIQNMFPYGIGALLQRYEQLKEKLKLQGLFAPEHKKPLPPYPEMIGIITSPTSAAIQDILNILQRRHPCEVEIYPSLMQGDSAPGQVIQGLSHFNDRNKVEIIIIARGGGSQEDLFCFNDENLARAIYRSDIPVVSAIGHEIDFTIADFVADLRAPTPSAAAELCTPDDNELNQILDQYPKSMLSAVTNVVTTYKVDSHRNQIRLMQYNPERIYQSLQQRFDEATAGLESFSLTLSELSKDFGFFYKSFCQDLINIGQKLIMAANNRQSLVELSVQYAIQDKVKETSHKTRLAEVTLKDLSIIKTLERGFSLIRSKGKIIHSIQSIQLKDDLELILSDGVAQAKVNSVSTNKT